MIKKVGGFFLALSMLLIAGCIFGVSNNTSSNTPSREDKESIAIAWTNYGEKL